MNTKNFRDGWKGETLNHTDLEHLQVTYIVDITPVIVILYLKI